MPSAAPTTFFSYCRQDKEFATRLAEDLKAGGANVWMDRLDIAPGQEWDDAVEDAVSQCPRMLLLLSPASVQSRNVRNEVAYALDEKKTIIPVLYQDCTIPLQLRRIQHIDFRTDYADGLKTLLKTLGAEQQTKTQGTSVAPVTAPEGFPARTDKAVHSIELPRIEHGRGQTEEAQPARPTARLEQGYSNSSEQNPPKGFSFKWIAAGVCGIVIVAFVIYFVVRQPIGTASNVPAPVLPKPSNVSPSRGGLSGNTDTETADKQRTDDPIGVDKTAGNNGAPGKTVATNSAPVKRRNPDPAFGRFPAIDAQAAEAGDPQGMYNLGAEYMRGEGVEYNLRLAHYWLGKAVAAGNSKAMVDLGFLYRNGYGVTEDHKQAEALYRQAAALGDGEGMTGLGFLAGDPRDKADWYRKGADAGSSEGAYRLAILYELGLGVGKDKQQEIVWCRKGVQLGGDFGSMCRDKLKSLGANP